MLRLREASGEGSLPAPDSSAWEGLRVTLTYSLCAETVPSGSRGRCGCLRWCQIICQTLHQAGGI